MNIITVKYADLGVEAGAYVAGDQLGELVSFKLHGQKGVIQTARLIDQAKQDATIDLVLFDIDPTEGTDNAAFDLADVDADNILGIITFNGYTDFNDNSICVVNNVGIAFNMRPDTMYAIAVIRDSATYAAVTDVQVQFTYEGV